MTYSKEEKKEAIEEDYRVANARKVNSKKFPNGYLYALKTQGIDMVKIGVSQNPKRRVRDLRSAMPFDLDLIFISKFKNVYELEKIAHNKLSEYNLKGEWYAFCTNKALSILDGLKNSNNGST